MLLKLYCVWYRRWSMVSKGGYLRLASMLAWIAVWLIATSHQFSVTLWWCVKVFVRRWCMQMAASLFLYNACILILCILKIYRAGRWDKRQNHRPNRICQTPKLVESNGWKGLWLYSSEIPSSYTTCYWGLGWLVSSLTGNAVGLSVCWCTLKIKKKPIYHKLWKELSCCNIFRWRP